MTEEKESVEETEEVKEEAEAMSKAEAEDESKVEAKSETEPMPSPMPSPIAPIASPIATVEIDGIAEQLKRLELKTDLLELGAQPSRIEDLIILGRAKGLGAAELKKAYPTSFKSETGTGTPPKVTAEPVAKESWGTRLAKQRMQNKKKGSFFGR